MYKHRKAHSRKIIYHVGYLELFASAVGIGVYREPTDTKKAVPITLSLPRLASSSSARLYPQDITPGTTLYPTRRVCAPGLSTSLLTAVAAGEESDENAEEGDDGVDEAVENAADATDDGHDAVSDGAEQASNLVL